MGYIERGTVIVCNKESGSAVTCAGKVIVFRRDCRWKYQGVAYPHFLWQVCAGKRPVEGDSLVLLLNGSGKVVKWAFEGKDCIGCSPKEYGRLRAKASGTG